MNGNHETGKTSADVSAVHAYLRTVNFIPDFTPVTRNVKGLSFVQCRLIMLRKQDLQPYNKLEYLWLNENYLKHLDGDAFMYNQNIKVINLQSNKLTKIDRNIFKNLISLEVLILNKNECLKNVTESKLHMADWMDKINEFCQNYPEVIVARPREEYKRNVREKTSIWVTFGVTFASFSVVVIVIVILYNIKRFISL
ncbi:unnamed protein product [Chironomus riparius]|uniref:Uncharacterized protein n=1 Tax=Chironomus riparius TaxID=315576 RepID=A0A9N9S665_9DIPT|nr:unnamed protein product [Chironomus riparius]